MPSSISTGAAHHITLTVTDVGRSQAFYEDLLGFQKVADYGERVVLHNGSLLLIIGPPPDPAQGTAGDRFNENRVGLDHLSLAVESRNDLETAKQLCEEQNIACGEIKELAPFAIQVLAIRDPDNIQIELTAPLA